MDVLVSIVGEASRTYTNMMKLLVYSLRENGGALAQSPVVLSTNGSAMPVEDCRELERMGPTRVRTMPRQPSHPLMNKFNGFYALEQDYDILLFLDSDTVVLGPLDEIIADLDPQAPQFRARVIGESGAQRAGCYEALVREFSLSETEVLADVADERFPLGYPLFNSGVIVCSRPAVSALRSDAASIAYSLITRRSKEAVRSISDLLWEIGDQLRDRFFLYTDAGWTYEYWMTEQLGLALAVLKNEIQYDVLAPAFNWVHDDNPPTGPPAVYHYLSGRHDIDRTQLFTGEWIEEYLNSDAPTRRAFAQLVREYTDRSFVS